MQVASNRLDRESIVDHLLDLLAPIRGRRFHAKVAPKIATKNGYCATKKLHYYGVKLHVVANRIKGSLPIPICLGLTDAGMHDRKAFEQILPELPQNMLECYADKTYQVKAEPIHQEQHVILLTPVKKKRDKIFLIPQMNGYLLEFQKFGNLSNHCSIRLTKKPVFKLQAKSDLIRV